MYHGFTLEDKQASFHNTENTGSVKTKTKNINKLPLPLLNVLNKLFYIWESVGNVAQNL